MCHEATVEIADPAGLDGEGGFGFDAGVGGGALGFRRCGMFGLTDHGGGQLPRIARWHEVAQPADAPSLGDAIKPGGNHRAAAGVSFEHHGGKGLGGDLRMDENVEGVVKGDRIRLLPDEPDAPLQSVVSDVFLQRCGQGAGAGEEELGLGQAADHVPGGTHKHPLALAHGPIESPDHAEDGVARMETQGMACRIGESPLPGAEFFCVDAGVDDMEFARIDPARRTMVTLRHRRGRVPVSMGQDFGDKSGNGDDRVGFCKQAASAQRGTGTFREMAAEYDKGGGLDEARGQEGGPVVVAVMRVNYPRPRAAEKTCQREDLQGAEFRQRLKRRGLRGKRGRIRAGSFHLPALLGEPPGQGQTLGVRTAPPQAGVQNDHAGG